ncbi:MAG: hypothetical protein IJV27_05815 [Prevotella sp.]|nr:hypothetical protein [Prevotella sp.]
MIKRLFYIAAAAVLSLALIVSCKRETMPEEQEGSKIVGVWELTDIITKSPQIGDVNVSVYIEFLEDKSFSVYQKIGLGRYSLFTGSYDLYSDETLSGKYSNDKAWGPYSVTIGEKTLTLKLLEGAETDIYTKVDTVPEAVRQNLY